ncbi:ATP-dependent endonuclease [Kitasatospora sp. NPDC059327]|uniref:ATP-dependent nuclease n=1 Tax=Kitasatospora sp. NPDC059327 TaxID=3346803 RepID=UPI00369E2103
MYLARVQAENFRIFGGPATDSDPGSALDLTLRPGLSVLVGENDSGKSAVIDAIRLCLTSNADFTRVTADDLHYGPGGRADYLQISCTFEGLDESELGSFGEFLTSLPGEASRLTVTLRAEPFDPDAPHRLSVRVRAGDTALDGEVRERLRATYLRPLRDAEGEMRAGRNSRLSQILTQYPGMQEQRTDDFDSAEDSAGTLVGILQRADHHINANTLVQKARNELNNGYMSRFTIGQDTLSGAISIATTASLQSVLERLELAFAPDPGLTESTRHGLGYNNALYMAAELLLLGRESTSPILLIEEPEAHMHPQLQTRVVDLLQERSRGESPVQIISTTHSPHIASSVPVEHLTLVAGGNTFPLRPEHTELDASDYAFLSRFLDATKANLFFARAVAMVEGDAEVLLLPALARAMGHSFAENGVSIVNVGSTGLFRYSRIFQRKDSALPPVRVACITDMDLAPDRADAEMAKKLKRWSSLTEGERRKRILKKQERDGGAVRTFVSNWWTLEYDLARASWSMATLMHQAISAAKGTKWPTAEDLVGIEETAAMEVKKWQEDDLLSPEECALRIYAPLRVGNTSKSIAAQHAARLLETSGITSKDLPTYLVEAVGYLCGSTQP